MRALLGRSARFRVLFISTSWAAPGIARRVVWRGRGDEQGPIARDDIGLFKILSHAHFGRGGRKYGVRSKFLSGYKCIVCLYACDNLEGAIYFIKIGAN